MGARMVHGKPPCSESLHTWTTLEFLPRRSVIRSALNSRQWRCLFMALLRLADPLRRCLPFGEERKWPAFGRNVAIDPKRTKPPLSAILPHLSAPLAGGGHQATVLIGLIGGPVAWPLTEFRHALTRGPPKMPPGRAGFGPAHFSAGCRCDRRVRLGGKFLLQFAKQSTRVCQVGRVEPLRETAEDGSEEIVRLAEFSLIAPKPRETHGFAQLPPT